MNNSQPPLIVDLDGTLVKTDFLYESFFQFIKKNPLNIFLTLFWLLSRNRAVMKSRIADQADIDVSLFPYNQGVLDWLSAEKSSGRQIVLATASHQKYAQAVADHLQFFDEVIATQGAQNIKGENKEKVLLDKYGLHGFDYVGDSQADLAVWRSARKAIVVTGSEKLLTQVSALTEIEKHFGNKTQLSAFFRAMRPHQWIKNTLLFVPLFTSHSFTLTNLWSLALAFIAFSLCASSIYIVNDLLDLQADRKHKSKRMRPFASGTLPIPSGIILMLVCASVALIAASLLSYDYLLVLLVYLFITTIYSFYLKHIMLADVIVLAGLYTLRIIAGAVAIEVELSFWLLAFSVFLFLSLAIIKRYTELLPLRKSDPAGTMTARGYETQDIPMLSALGCASGYIAVLVMALYLNSEDILKLYQHPKILWLVCPAMLYWISRIWILAQRGKVHDDPIVFVIKDTNSRVIALIVFLLFLAAA